MPTTSSPQGNPENYSFDARAGQGCLEEARTVFDGQTCSAYSRTFDYVCRDAWIGHLEPGASCYTSMECSAEGGESASCVFTEDLSDTICRLRRRVSEGDACTITCDTAEEGGGACSSVSGPFPEVDWAECHTSDGLYCSSDFQCVSQVGVGEPCERPLSCASGRCLSSTGLCAEKRTAGQECSVSAECAAGLYCSEEACVPLLAPGSECETLFECADRNCIDGVCAVKPMDDDPLRSLCEFHSL